MREKRENVVVTGISLMPEGGNLYKIRVAPGGALPPGVWFKGGFGEKSLEALKNATVALPSYIKGIEAHSLVVSVPSLMDGPSCGLPLFLAMYAVLNNKPINGCYAYSGEINPEGGLVPIGGLAEKLATVKRAGLKGMVFPTPEEPALNPGLLLCPVSTLDEAITIATL